MNAQEIRWRIEDITQARSLLCNSGFAYAASIVKCAASMTPASNFLSNAADEIAQMETQRAEYDKQLDALFKAQEALK
jgi:hypothetical protein